jgi:hypothetical protein
LRAPTPDDSEELTDLQETRVLRVRHFFIKAIPQRAQPDSLSSCFGIQEKLNALEAKLLKRGKKPRVKDEGGVIDLTQDSSRSKRAKVEGKRPFISGEVIDLT